MNQQYQLHDRNAETIALALHILRVYESHWEELNTEEVTYLPEPTDRWMESLETARETLRAQNPNL